MVSGTPRPQFTPGKDPVPILQEAGWAPVPVWTGEKSRPHRDSIPDRPARSQSLYRLSYRVQTLFQVETEILNNIGMNIMCQGQKKKTEIFLSFRNQYTFL